ncbi:MAG: sigma-70 family RNA polymerase sigma factor [Actinomycetota bacterium]|nr:sigma-70 family RNA polymerase sigma factor [Actinomycetota bacterium]
MDDDAELAVRLRAGDEGAFVILVDRFHAPLLRLASTFVPNRTVAEEVVQDTWLGVVRGIGRFEGRSSLKTWLFRILVNRARSTGVRERRYVAVDPEWAPAVPPERFGPGGQWSDPPTPWTDDAEERIVARQTVERITAHLAELPEAQRQVVVLRDFERLPAPEVCDLLGITEANQRVLLHRGRSKIRSLLEAEHSGDIPSPPGLGKG